MTEARTAADALALARALRDRAQWPELTLRRLLALYCQRGDVVMAGLVRHELRERERERVQAPLPYDVTLWG